MHQEMRTGKDLLEVHNILLVAIQSGGCSVGKICCITIYLDFTLMTYACVKGVCLLSDIASHWGDLDSFRERSSYQATLESAKGFATAERKYCMVLGNVWIQCMAFIFGSSVKTQDEVKYIAIYETLENNIKFGDLVDAFTFCLKASVSI